MGGQFRKSYDKRKRCHVAFHFHPPRVHQVQVSASGCRHRLFQAGHTRTRAHSTYNGLTCNGARRHPQELAWHLLRPRKMSACVLKMVCRRNPVGIVFVHLGLVQTQRRSSPGVGPSASTRRAKRHTAYRRTPRLEQHRRRLGLDLLVARFGRVVTHSRISNSRQRRELRQILRYLLGR